MGAYFFVMAAGGEVTPAACAFRRFLICGV